MNSNFNGVNFFDADLFEAYIALISATLSAQADRRLVRTIRYDDLVEASNQATAQAILAAMATYEQATYETVSGFRQRFVESQRLLNEEIGAANEVYQSVEKQVALSIDVRRELAELTGRKDALVFAAAELGSEDLEVEAVGQFEEAKQALFARRDAALEPAREIYQSRIADMHLRHQERLRVSAFEQAAFVEPHAMLQEQAIDELRLKHTRLVAKEKLAATKDLAAFDQLFYQQEQTRLAELDLLKRAGASKEASARFLAYCEGSTQLLKERAHS